MSDRAALEQHLRDRNYEAALSISTRLMQTQSFQADIAAMHGHALKYLGRWKEARDALERAGTAMPRIPSVWVDLAQTCAALSDWSAAAQAIERFRVLMPNAAIGVFVAAEIALGMGREQAALTGFQRALNIQPALLPQWLRLAGQDSDHGQFERAQSHYLAMLQLAPDALPVHMDYLACLFRHGRFDQALQQARAAIKRWPEHAPLLHRYSILLDHIDGSPQERLQIRQQWLRVAPQSVDAHFALASAYAAIGDFPNAHAHWAQASNFNPADPLARWTALHFPDAVPAADTHQLQRFRQRWDRELENFAAQTVPDAITCLRLAQSCQSHHLIYADDDVLGSLKARGRQLTRYCDVALPNAEPPSPSANARRRVGVVSASFGWHSVSRVWQQLMLSVSRESIDLIGFSLDSTADESVAIWRAGMDEFITTAGSIEDWHRCLQQARLDVLIFLDLGPGPMAQALATRRYAPVQCTTWAFPVSSGLDSIDYFMSSDLMEPEQADDHYCESLVRLPGLACSYRPESLPSMPSTEDRSSPPARFLCSQSVFKLRPVQDSLFARVLSAVADSTLTLSHGGHAFSSAAIRQRLAPVLLDAGIDVDSRLNILSHMPYSDYLDVLSKTDIVLDTPHFSGCLTSLDALSLGIPIVTLPGITLRSRQTAAMLEVLGAEELIAKNEDDYVRIATRLATDLAWRRQWSELIRTRRERLYDFSESAAALSRFLETVQPRHRAPSVR